MMASQGIVTMPDWLPAQYRNPRHSFETGMERFRYCAPALEEESEREDLSSFHWAEQVVAEENSNSNSEGPPLQEVPVVFSSADLRNKDTAERERSKLAVNVMDFGGKELKKEWRNRASETDLMRHLER